MDIVSAVSDFGYTKYEWVDDTGLAHPSLVLIDVTGLPEDFTKDERNFCHMAEKVVKVTQIDSFNDVFQRGHVIIKNRIPAGWEFRWYHMEMNASYYAVFFAISREDV